MPRLPSADCPIGLQCQEDPRVADAMERIAQGVQELRAALSTIGNSTPRLAGLLPLLAPDMAAKAVREGLTRDDLPVFPPR